MLWRLATPLSCPVSEFWHSCPISKFSYPTMLEKKFTVCYHNNLCNGEIMPKYTTGPASQARYRTARFADRVHPATGHITFLPCETLSEKRYLIATKPPLRVVFFSTVFWRLATLPLRVPSPQPGLTAVFGMRTGVAPAINHQNTVLNKKK